MTVCLVMCAGGRAADPAAAVQSVRGLVDAYHVVDTGVEPEAREALEDALAGLDGDLVDDPFDGSGPSFTRALEGARGKADWLLHLHSDETADVFPTLAEWLVADESPDTDAWWIPIVNPGLVHRLPRLLRDTREWAYVGNAHEYLEIDHARARWLNGLTINHHGGASPPDKFEYVLDQLAGDYALGDPRATFYTAEALRDLGRVEEAVVVYRERAAMVGTWEEERWYADFQAAKLSGDVDALLEIHGQRPHRHEPLAAAAAIVRASGTSDVLFVEG